MRDEKRIDIILEDLKLLWHNYPDLRLCQLLSFIADQAGWESIDLFFLEDDVVASQIRKELGKERKF